MNSTNRCTEADVTQWLKPILEKEKLQNYTFEILGCSEKGDGYLGDITFVQVDGKTQENEMKSYNFVVKSAKKSDQLRKVIPVKSAFENEIHFYENILPTYLEFQREKGIEEPFYNTAKCHGTLILENMEVLVLENLKKSDYSLHDRTHPMSKEHIRLVVKTYGKLHALSFALHDQKPEVFNCLSNKLVDVMKLMGEVAKNSPIKETKFYQDIVNIAQISEEFEVVDKLTTLENDVRNFSDLFDDSNSYSVILHGDCWNNNFMFKYGDPDKSEVTDVCLLDFQLSRLGSPVMDLSYFLFTCIDEDDLENFDEIMEVYYKALTDFVRELGSDPLKLFPFAELSNQWTKFGKFGIIMLPNIAKICLLDSNDVPDLAESTEAGIDLMDTFSFSAKNIPAYEKRTLPMMKFAVSRNII